MALNIATLNIYGLRDVNKRMGFIQWFLFQSWDILCLQECHVLSSEECAAWFSAAGYDSVVSPGSNRSRGSVILFKKSIALKNHWVDSEGRLVLVEFATRELSFRVCCLYAPNQVRERSAFFESVCSIIDPGIPTVVCGDFNTVVDRSTDRRGSDPLDMSRESSLALINLFRACCVTDVWRDLHPLTPGFTWESPDHSRASRIDLIGCPAVWAPFVSSCSIVPCPFSDHAAVFLSLSPPVPIPRGPGRWKCNVSVFRDPTLRSKIESFWLYWRSRQPFFPSVGKWWDKGKKSIKSLISHHCAVMASRSRQERDLLARLADHLKRKLDAGMTSVAEPLESVLLSIADMDRAAAAGARVRARTRWAEEGESSSRYFFRREKKRGADQWCSALRQEDGTIASSAGDICAAWSAFYSLLFSAEPVDPGEQDYLLQHLESTLPDDASSSCDGPLTEDELLAAVRGMARGKAPGLDGLPLEFYLSFWSLLAPDLLTMLNFSFREGRFPISLRTGVISLLFKKGDRLNPANWRPITLLNTDYKICARALAARLLGVIHRVVGPDQTCGVPGRFIGENVALLRDLAHYCDVTDFPAAILSLDQEKAFDRVDWDFLFRTLSFMGFGVSFIRWIRLLYTRPRCSVFVNGYISPAFFPSRGVRQGCPLSPLLYVLTMEVLACSVRASPIVKGITLPGVSTRLPVLSLFADDVSVIVSSVEAMEEVFHTYARFEKGTGSKLNLNKCEGLWLGGWRGRPDSPVPFQWTSNKIKVLGTFIGNGCLVEANWRPRVDAVANCVSAWSGRRLSYGGKALVSNALALARVWYLATMFPLPGWALAELNRIIFSFFWRGKVDQVARAVVCQPRGCGGFGLVSARLKCQALLLQWVRRFWTSSHGWRLFLSYWTKAVFRVGPAEVFAAPFCFDIQRLPPFYEAVLGAWRAVEGHASADHSVFYVGDPPLQNPLSSITCKSCYEFFLDAARRSPHCERKFSLIFGPLHWPATWRQVHLMPLDRPVIDLCWRVSHGVVYTLERLVGFGYDLDPSCFCGHPLESLFHLFFSCPLAQSGVSWAQSILFRAAPLAPTLEVKHLLFGFSEAELAGIPGVFVYILNVLKFQIWQMRNNHRYRQVAPGAVGLIAATKARVRFYLPLFAKRFVSARRRRYFSRQWGASGVIGRFRDGNFSVTF